MLVVVVSSPWLLECYTIPANFYLNFGQMIVCSIGGHHDQVISHQK